MTKWVNGYGDINGNNGNASREFTYHQIAVAA
jgi:hypothetical protein